MLISPSLFLPLIFHPSLFLADIFPSPSLRDERNENLRLSHSPRLITAFRLLPWASLLSVLFAFFSTSSYRRERAVSANARERARRETCARLNQRNIISLISAWECNRNEGERREYPRSPLSTAASFRAKKSLLAKILMPLPPRLPALRAQARMDAPLLSVLLGAPFNGYTPALRARKCISASWARKGYQLKLWKPGEL